MNPPKLLARFVLDEDGKPSFVMDGDLKHYKIRLFVDDAPERVDSVTYQLHDSYFNPVREVIRKSEQSRFEEEITSYGDFQIRTSLSGSTKIRGDRQDLTRALRLGHAQDEGDRSAIELAIEDLAKR